MKFGNKALMAAGKQFMNIGALTFGGIALVNFGIGGDTILVVFGFIMAYVLSVIGMFIIDYVEKNGG